MKMGKGEGYFLHSACHGQLLLREVCVKGSCKWAPWLQETVCCGDPGCQLQRGSLTPLTEENG